MKAKRIIEKNLCGACKHSFTDYLGENGCHKGSKDVNKYGGLTECYWWESK